MARDDYTPGFGNGIHRLLEDSGKRGGIRSSRALDWIIRYFLRYFLRCWLTHSSVRLILLAGMPHLRTRTRIVFRRTDLRGKLLGTGFEIGLYRIKQLKNTRTAFDTFIEAKIPVRERHADVPGAQTPPVAFPKPR